MMKILKQIISIPMALSLGLSMLPTGIASAADDAEQKTYDISFVNDSYKADTTGIDFGRAGDQWRRGQTFVALEGGNMKSVEVKVIAMNNPGDITAALYATDPLGGISGEALAYAEADKSLVSSTGFSELNIPLKYDKMIAGKMYAVVLSQKTKDGWYGWYCSFDANNSAWWEPSVYNPQINQPGYEGNLPSYKITDTEEIVDDSRCGDLWLKVNYTPSDSGEETDVQKPEKSLEDLYEKDMNNGGLSFYMDRVLARPGKDPSLIEDSGLMTRGRALYTKGTNDNGLIKEFGFGGIMHYIKDDRAGYTIRINGKPASDFTENISERVDYPSYWTSGYEGRNGSVNSGLSVKTRRFITENNVAVTILDIENKSQTEKTVKLTMDPAYCTEVINEYTLGGNIFVDYRKLNLKASMDGGEVSGKTIERTVKLPAGITTSVKAQLGYTDPKDKATEKEYETYAAYSHEQAFSTHVQAYNRWWVDNIPYMWVSDPVLQKMIAYRWWITRINTVDAGTTNYPFPTSMEGVFGYNNAIVNAVPWQMDEMRYLRSPLLEYGTWADAAFAAQGGIYRDNPAGRWGVKPQHYISKAGWESYKVHGGQTEFLNAMANAGAGDVDGTSETFDPDGDALYDIQYDAWDNDTASLAVLGKQERIDTAALAWCNANAVSEMYSAAGNAEQAKKYSDMAQRIKSINLENAWDAETKQFLMKMADTKKFNPFRDINNYYGFMVGMIPQSSGYDQALNVWGDENEFPAWPMYVSNSKDYNTIQSDSRYTNRSRNYSPGNIAITLKMFASAIKNYKQDAITAADFGALLKNYTTMCFANKNILYPDANEFWNGNPDSPYRSWIHHNFHSQYNTLLIENVMGLTPRDDRIIEFNPIDIGLKAFKLSELRYHDSDISIELNENGYQLSVNGELVASLDKLCRFTWDSATGEVKVLDNSGAAVVSHKAVSGFKTPYEIKYTAGRTAEVINAAVAYKPGDTVVEKDETDVQPAPEHDASYKLKTSDGSNWEDNFNLDFGDWSGDQFKRAQMFVAAEGGAMSGVQVMIQNKNAVKDVTVELYDANANGAPGKSLTKTTISAGKVPFGGMGIVTADLEYQLEKGKKYYVVLGQDSGGSGIYCWALSAKDMNAGTQAVQEGYSGDLRMYKIERSNSMLHESALGDFYLEVFYKNTDKPDLTEFKAAVSAAQKVIVPEYIEKNIKDGFENALKSAEALLSAEGVTLKQIQDAANRLEASLKAVDKARVPAADAVIALINSISDNVTAADKAKAAQARAAYNALDDSLKPLIANYSKLTAAETAIKAFKNGFIKGADGKSYYWKDNAKVANAWVVSGGKTYRTDLSGAMITGTRVIKTGGKSYIIVNSVRAQGSAWVKCGKKTYRIKSGAVMSGKKAKRIKVGKKYYILDKSGARVQSKVVKVGKKLYYAAKSGAIKKNTWIKYKGKSYYALKSGSLAAGKAIKIKGKKYTFAKNGVCKSKK